MTILTVRPRKRPVGTMNVYLKKSHPQFDRAWKLMDEGRSPGWTEWMLQNPDNEAGPTCCDCRNPYCSEPRSDHAACGLFKFMGKAW